MSDIKSNKRSSPHNHLVTGPHRRVPPPAAGRMGSAGRRPNICFGIVSPPGVKIGSAGANSAPNDHFRASPNCRVQVSTCRRVRRAGGCPAIRGWIVSAASAQIGIGSAINIKKIAAPDNHFTARPNRARYGSTTGRIGRAYSCPTVRDRIVFPAGIRIIRVRIVTSGPDDHVTASPYRRMA